MARIMDPPWPMQYTPLASASRPAARSRAAGFSSSKVWAIALVLAWSSFSPIPRGVSFGETSPQAPSTGADRTADLAMASLKAEYPPYPRRRQNREMVASATPQLSAKSEIDRNCASARWPIRKSATFFSEAVSL